MRKAGILMHISSLPSPEGIGTFGREAYEFVDFLVKSKQKIWQILPLTYTSPIDKFSPYKSVSVFSGNTDFIDIRELHNENLCSYPEFISSDPCKTDYEYVRKTKIKYLKEAYKNRFNMDLSEYDEFIKKNDFCLKPFAKYLKNNTIDEIETEYVFFTQYLFFKQWNKLHKYANDKGISILGDMPIYISENSADFDENKDLFLTDKNGNLSGVAGVPPDAFSSVGQHWGNPLYNWEKMEDDNFAWWMKRFEFNLSMYDIIRMDHFRAFDRFYAIYENNGKWLKGPGKKFFDIFKAKFPNAKIIAEDLGIIDDGVRDLLKYTGFPGMKVLEFAFDSDNNNLNLPHNYEKNVVSYTGTHDNKTLKEWLETEDRRIVDYAIQYMRLDTYDKYTEGMVRTVFSSVADTVIIPIQDWLDLGKEDRMNTPSTTFGNWLFRIKPNVLTEELSNKISYLTTLYGR